MSLCKDESAAFKTGICATFASFFARGNQGMTSINGVEVGGHFDQKFAPAIEQFAENIAKNNDVGASFAASIDGEMVVDVWGGHQDEQRTRPWQEDTLVNVWSSTKTVSFLCALVLADRGLLDFDAPVSRYWPEFAANGKENVLVWHFMNHAAGLSGLDEEVSQDDQYDWDKMTGLLAAQEPWWEPGSSSGYHGLTQGYLIGELVRRITGQTLGEFTRDEIAGPLGADFHIGAPDEVLPRICDLIIPGDTTSNNDQLDDDPDSISRKTFRSPRAQAEAANTLAWRKAEIPAANGQGNARSLVRIQTPLANDGGAFGVQLVSADTAKSIMKQRIAGKDLVLKMPMAFGLGFGLNTYNGQMGPIPLTPNPNSCFWAGWGGSSVVIDQDAHIVTAYAMNRMFPSLMGDTRSYLIRQKFYEGLS